MQVFKAFFKITRKRLDVFIIYIVCFVSVCVIMTKTNSSDAGFKTSKVDVIVTDLDNSAESREFISFLSENHKVKEKSINKNQITDFIYYRRADVVLTIEKGFGEKLAEGSTDGLMSEYNVPGTFTAEFFDNQINRYISTVNAYITGGYAASDAMHKAAEICSSEVSVDIVSSSGSSTEYGRNMSGYFQYIPYIIIIILITGVCPTMLVLTGKDIRSRTNCSCISTTRQVLETVLGTLVIVAALYILLMAVAYALYGGLLFSSAGLKAMLNSFVFMIFSVMFSLLVSVTATKIDSLNMIAQIFGLGMSFLCGVFVPQMILSDTVLAIGRFLPAYWYIKANNMLAGSNNEIYSTKGYLMCIGIELAFAATMLCVTLLVAKTKRSSKSA